MQPKMATVIMALLTTLNIGCADSSNTKNDGTNVLVEFVNTFAGTFKEDDQSLLDQEQIEIQSNYSLRRDKIEKVSVEAGSEICGFQRRGPITSVIKRSERQKAKYLDFATHVLHYTIYQLDLMEKYEDKEACKKQLQTLQAQLPISYVEYFEVLNSDSLRFHTEQLSTANLANREEGDSTTDETFLRVSEQSSEVLEL